MKDGVFSEAVCAAIREAAKSKLVKVPEYAIIKPGCARIKHMYTKIKPEHAKTKTGYARIEPEYAKIKPVYATSDHIENTVVWYLGG